jgi:hypothetical protein
MKIRQANGSHCHATIRITASSGQSAMKSIGCAPTNSAIWANTP